MLKKEQLVEIGIEGEKADKVVQIFQSEISGNFIPKERFDQVNTLKNDLTKQIEELKKSTGSVDDLKKQIEEIQSKTNEQQKKYEAEIEKMKIISVLDKTLLGSKAKNVDAVKGLIQDFINTATLEENGMIKGLDEKIKELKAGENTAFLFEGDSGNTSKNFIGTTPETGNNNTNPPKTNSVNQEEAFRNYVKQQIGG